MAQAVLRKGRDAVVTLPIQARRVESGGFCALPCMRATSDGQRTSDVIAALRDLGSETLDAGGQPACQRP